MKDCIFCKIKNKELPAEILYEDEYTLAFLDINPVNPGHTLVIPKKHEKNILDISEETLSKVMETVRIISPKIQQSLGADGLNIGINNESGGGQVVFHMHIHIIPRFKDDGIKLWPQKKYRGNEAEEIAKKIKSLL